MKKKQLWFLTGSKDCPLGFAERLVYSHLVSKARYGKVQTGKDIAANVGLHRSSAVADSLDVLKSHGLAENSKVGWCALPPSEDTGNWFVKKEKCKSPEWYDQFAYFPITFPKREKLSTRCAVVYWFLVARRNLRRPQNITGIANLLSIGWATADRAVKQLRELGLINDQLRPTEVRRDDLWREGKMTKPKQVKPDIIDNYRLSSLFMSGFSLDAFRGDRQRFDDHADRIGTKMRRAGYTEEEIGEYILATYHSFGPKLKNDKMSWFMLFSLEPLFNNAERETANNRQSGRYRGKTSFGLLQHMTQLFVERINKGHERFDDVQIFMFEVAA